MEEIDLKNVLQIILKRWYIVLVAAIICTAAAAVISVFILQPVYQADTTLYIGKTADDDKNELTYNDLMLSSQLVKDYRELVKSRLIGDEVIKELKLDNISADTLTSKLNVTQKSDTRVIMISATDTNSAMAAAIANKVAEVFVARVTDIMQVKNVRIIDTAQVPRGPVKPNKKMNVAIGFMLGIMLGLGVIFVIEYFDSTIKTTDDVKKYLDLPVIGTIPVFPEN